MTNWCVGGLAAMAGLCLVLAGPAPASEIVYDLGGPLAGSCPAGGCASCGGGAPMGCSSGQCHGPKVPCPPPYCHVFEAPPCLKYKKGCPRPVCDPCNLEHFGYYPTCWSPWPYPPNWSHCPYPTAAAMLPPPRVPPFTPKLYGVRPAPVDRTDRTDDPRRKYPDRPGPARMGPDRRDSPDSADSDSGEEERPTPTLPGKSERLHPPSETPGKPSVRLITR